MAIHDVDAVFFVDRPPEIRYRDGTFHVTYDVGRKARFEMVFKANAFLRALKAAESVADEYYEEQRATEA